MFPSTFSRHAGRGALLVFALSIITSGCSTSRYLWQAAGGQLSLLNHARPIVEVLKDEKESPRIRGLLAEIPKIKSFGEKNGVRATSNYQEYVRLDRAAAVWVVSAARPLQFTSKEWSFPIVGRFPYLGWFDLKNAKSYAKELEGEGWDVDVRGAGAYSTLGWFRDPILSSMIFAGNEALGELVNVVLHESVHATVYISGQAYFNESLASFVADHLTPLYLGSQSELKVAWEKNEAEGKTRAQKLHEAYESLSRLYAIASKSDEEKLREKKTFLDQLRSELGWKRPLNNAALIQFKTYTSASSDFERVWLACGGSSSRFLTLMLQLKEHDFQKNQQDDLKPVLDRLISLGCSP